MIFRHSREDRASSLTLFSGHNELNSSKFFQLADHTFPPHHASIVLWLLQQKKRKLGVVEEDGAGAVDTLAHQLSTMLTNAIAILVTFMLLK